MLIAVEYGMNIKGKVIIVTGASQGIGLASAKHFAKLGAKVVLTARSFDIIKNLEKELPNSLAVKTDMCNRQEIKNLVSLTLEKYGRIDVLLNNAGHGMVSTVENINMDDFRKVMDLNLYGALDAMQEVIPQMRKQGGGAMGGDSPDVVAVKIAKLVESGAEEMAMQ
jgi:NADP-dependent 3-hydroxy acid dehydrogenase YdfG